MQSTGIGNNNNNYTEYQSIVRVRVCARQDVVIGWTACVVVVVVIIISTLMSLAVVYVTSHYGHHHDCRQQSRPATRALSEATLCTAWVISSYNVSTPCTCAACWLLLPPRHSGRRDRRQTRRRGTWNITIIILAAVVSKCTHTHTHTLNYSTH